jgi:hypothetical protein
MLNLNKTKNALSDKVKNKTKQNNISLPAQQLQDAKVLPDVSEQENGIKSNSFYNYADNLDNPKRLTIMQLRSYKGLSKISDQLAQEIIDGLYKLSIITYKIHTQNGT